MTKPECNDIPGDQYNASWGSGCGIITLEYPAEKPERFEKIKLNKLVHYERYDRAKNK
jgi:hypothetical protein